MPVRRAARRDANEGAIVEALISVGASVLYLSIKDVPDLLVGYRGVDHLLEVKQEGRRGASIKSIHAELSDDQAAWHQAWRGRAPVVVRTPAEALAAIGALAATVSVRQPGTPIDVDPMPNLHRCTGCDLVYDANEVQEYVDGFRPPIHWTESAQRPLPLCPGWNRAGAPIGSTP